MREVALGELQAASPRIDPVRDRIRRGEERVEEVARGSERVGNATLGRGGDDACATPRFVFFLRLSDYAPCGPGLFVGWADHVFKALLRDGSFFVCRQPTGVNVRGAFFALSLSTSPVPCPSLNSLQHTPCSLHSLGRSVSPTRALSRRSASATRSWPTLTLPSPPLSVPSLHLLPPVPSSVTSHPVSWLLAPTSPPSFCAHLAPRALTFSPTHPGKAACALGGPCAEQPAEVEGEGGPSKAIGLWDIDAEGMCHNSEEARIETGLRMANDGLDAEDPDALTALAGSPGGSSAMEQSHRLTARCIRRAMCNFHPIPLRAFTLPHTSRA